MKNLLIKPVTRFTLLSAAVAVMLSACTTTNRIYTENDVVYSTKRFELKYYVRDNDRKSPLIYFYQSIVKVQTPGKETSYSAWDILTLTNSSFTPDAKVFYIIDNEVFPMKVDRMELENTKDISEEFSSLSTSDSTSVSVVTGYSENNLKKTRFNYTIPPEIMDKIKGSEQFIIRYYAGPHMITVKPKTRSLQKIKQLVDKN
jgi:hypothetical protein